MTRFPQETLRLVPKIVRHRLIEQPLWQWRNRQFSDIDFQSKFLRRMGSAGIPEHDVVRTLKDRCCSMLAFSPASAHAFRAHLEGSRSKVLANAESVMQNKADLLGSGPTHLGDNINWLRDFKSGRVWPLVYHTEVDQYGLGDRSDIKVPWDLSRFHQAIWLGKAYWLTGDERYAQKFATLIESWLEQNPYGYGIHWVNAMEVAFRACNWIYALGFFAESPSLSEAFWLRYFRALYLHGDFIRHNLEVGRVAGNHYVSDGAGLWFIGQLFISLREGRGWQALGRKILEEEMLAEVLPDGANYEQAISYHRLVLEVFYASAILGERLGQPFSARFSRRLYRMFDFVLHYTKPDGSAPWIGDADDGRLFRFSTPERHDDHRSALAVGAILFGDEKFAAVCGDQMEDALWLIGAEELDRRWPNVTTVATIESKAFAASGYYFLRHEDQYCVFDAGPIGSNEWGGHGHRDTLSFEIVAGGQTFITDSGTPCYTSAPHLYKAFSSTSAHNTIRVDEKDVAELESLWKLVDDPTQPKVTRFESQQDRDVVEAVHHGYTRLPQPVLHRRRIEFARIEKVWTIVDVVEGTGDHDIEFFLHLRPDISVVEDAAGWWLRGEHKALRIETEAQLQIIEGEVAPSFGVTVASKVLYGRWRAEVPWSMTTTIRVLSVEADPDALHVMREDERHE